MDNLKDPFTLKELDIRESFKMWYEIWRKLSLYEITFIT